MLLTCKITISESFMSRIWQNMLFAYILNNKITNLHIPIIRDKDYMKIIRICDCRFQQDELTLHTFTLVASYYEDLFIPYSFGS